MESQSHPHPLTRAYREIARWSPTWRPGKLAQHGGVLLGWMLLRAGAQAAAVVLLARMLGAEKYGQVVASLAVATFVMPFVGLGLSNIVLRNGARDPTHLPIYMGRAVSVWLASLVPGILLAGLLAALLLPAGVAPLAIFAAIAAELVATSLTELSARHWQAQHRIHRYGAINAGLPCVRLAALVLLFVASDSRTTEAVLWTHAASSLAYALLLWMPIRGLARRAGDASEPMTVTTGVPFSLANAAVRLQAEFNKPVLARVGFDLAGAYNVGQRAVDLASMPLQALLESMWPRLYAQRDPARQLRRTGGAVMMLAMLLGCVLWLAAPFLPRLVGPSYEDAIDALRMLAWLPVFQVFRGLLNFHAIHSGRLALLGWASAFGATAAVAGVVVLVPRYGVPGAVIASYASETVMIACLIVGARRHVRVKPAELDHADT